MQRASPRGEKASSIAPTQPVGSILEQLAAEAIVLEREREREKEVSESCRCIATLSPTDDIISTLFSFYPPPFPLVRVFALDFSFHPLFPPFLFFSLSSLFLFFLFLPFFFCLLRNSKLETRIGTEFSSLSNARWNYFADDRANDILQFLSRVSCFSFTSFVQLSALFAPSYDKQLLG